MNKQLTNDCIKLLEANKNLVLTGAPGTGKTFLARQIAAQMVLGKEIENLDSLTSEQKDLLDAHTAFVQFHLSYDYTDFVEGLRPISAENGEIKFERKDGVFKEFCKRGWLEELEEVELLKKAIRNEYNLAYKEIVDGKLTEIPVKNGEGKATFAKGNGFWGLATGFNRKSGELGETPKLEHFDILIEHGLFEEKDFKLFKEKKRKLRDIGITQNDSDTSYIMMYLYNRLQKKKLLTIKNPKPYVFIIDEINRGELSKIFGELFFSIDPGYRGDKSIRVQTQYQNLITEKADPFKDGFYVPENVYIIGTMNDIDRSIESMDFAIRRRFAWTEIKADENIDMLDKLGDRKDKAQEVMKALNTEIEMIEGLSSAYHIGASYFLKLDNYKDSQYPYQDLWDYHLKGLLTEYLRGLEDAGTKLDELKNAYDEASKETNSAEG